MTGPVLASEVAAVLFDKDGTLVDFHATWDAAFGAALRTLAGDEHQLAAAAVAVGYDLDSGRVHPGSILVAESNQTIAAVLAHHLPAVAAEPQRLEEEIAVRGVTDVREAPGASALLRWLRRRRVPTAIVTNDSEALARTQLDVLGWAELVDEVIGYDSGHGAKPDPGPVLAACRLLAVEPGRAWMVGDSVHDLESARRAGAVAVYVGDDPELAGLADHAVRDLTLLTPGRGCSSTG